CSLGANGFEDWSTRGTARPIYGILSLCFALITILFYTITAVAIWPMRRLSHYKIMLLLAISDIGTLLTNSLSFGVLLILYYNMFVVFNNTVMPTLSVLAYLVMLLFLLTRGITLVRKRMERETSRGETIENRAKSSMSPVNITITLAVFGISMFAMPSERIMYVAHTAWQLEHGTPPFIYVIFNKNIRDGVKQLLSPVSTSMMTMNTTVVAPTIGIPVS
ncbi:hypothetical protein PFISCL1PPCAC_12810, partial [Pristionchus fissidentatus]